MSEASPATNNTTAPSSILVPCALGLVPCALGLVLCALGLLLWLAARPGDPAPRITELKPTAEQVSAPTQAETSHPERVPLAEPSEAQTEAPLTDLLLEAHRAFHARDSAALSEALESILIEPASALEVLEGLTTNRWFEPALPLSAAEDGARLAIGAGAALYASSESPTEAAFSERFLSRALTALLEMRAGLAELMTRELARAEVEGARVWGAEWLPRLLHLRWRHPDRAALFDLLLETACRGADADGALLTRLLLSGEEDPGLLRVALGRLLREDPLHWMSVARDWYERASDIETRSALASAIATAAPLPEATRFFADVSDPTLLAELRSLATREGGARELADLYEERLLSEDDPRGRRTIVSGLVHEPDLCLGIARTDPDSGVRGQALLTATVDGVSEESLDILRAAWRAGEDPYYGVAPRHLVWASSNAALHATEDLRPVALQLLRSLALDHSFPASVRLDACERLERWLTPSDHAALEAELSSSLPKVTLPQETP